jgi:hypothetical protein
MQDHDDNNSTTQNPQDHDSTQYSASSFTHNTPATTSTAGTAEKTTGWWTEQEINLLLNYVEENCILTTARGLNMKKSEFNKARDMVKSKNAAQCHYKWGHVDIFIIIEGSNYYLSIHHSYVLSTKQSRSGTKNLAAVGIMTMVLMHEGSNNSRIV